MDNYSEKYKKPSNYFFLNGCILFFVLVEIFPVAFSLFLSFLLQPLQSFSFVWKALLMLYSVSIFVKLCQYKMMKLGRGKNWHHFVNNYHDLRILYLIQVVKKNLPGHQYYHTNRSAYTVVYIICYGCVFVIFHFHQIQTAC